MFIPFFPIFGQLYTSYKVSYIFDSVWVSFHHPPKFLGLFELLGLQVYLE